MKDQYHSIYFLGVGGIGVSALAQMALARGVSIAGSDAAADPGSNPALRRLLDGGATIYADHSADHLPSDCSLVVTSAAVPADNPEIAAARKRGIPVVSRAEFLGRLMASHRGPKIAVAGTHGKTTTTGMLGVMLAECGTDPTVFVGGEVPELGGNVRIGSDTGPFVAEACEAYDSFLALHPDVAIVTNVEADHLDHYGTEAGVKESFARFIAGMPQSGAVVVCGDDPRALETVSASAGERRVLEYGVLDRFYSGSRGKHLELGETATFQWHHGPPATAVSLSVAGSHNVQNALAAATAGLLLGLNSHSIAAGLARFHGSTRRLDTLGDAGADGHSVRVVDDYAHHPTEIRAVVQTMRESYPGRRLVAIFQPHLFSRTRDFLDEFSTALSGADALIVTDIYPAREQPIPGVRAADIANRASALNPEMPAIYVPNRSDIPAMLEGLARPGDIVLFMGAGDIREQAQRFLREYGTRG